MAVTVPGEQPRRSAAGRGAPDLKQERAHRTRESVLVAAAEAFAAHGFPSVTILDIAELAGVTKGAVYFHFANKEALALAVAEEFYQRLPAIASQVRRLDLGPREKVAELILRTATAFRTDRVIQAGARLQIERAFIDASLPTPYTDFATALTELLTEAHEEGRLGGGVEPAVLSRVLVAAFFGAQHISWVQNDRKDLQARAEEILATVLP